ncbi:Protein of unknown function, DUF547 [Flavobacteriaceae bacterium MAR_2010_188]|nr:Protein of unknown function, DUF547 [Flavobacteriaceae bacterium MAR_2010_188]
MKTLFITTLVCFSMSACFSNKGLPIKEVQKNGTEMQQTKPLTEFTVDHSAWDKLLKKYVADNGTVNYKGFKEDSKPLNDYINYLSKQVPTEDWSVQEQLAYFINVYNANTVKLIVENYPTKSIKDISNPWLKNRIKVGDQDFSLAGIENGILRKMNEPRIHFAINCASISCPKILNTAYTAANAEELLQRAATEFVNNPAKNEISANKLQISEIFKWYEGDFTENGTIIDYLNKYSKTKIQAGTAIDYKNYDWGLNE